jgi:hypothetical protein
MMRFAARVVQAAMRQPIAAIVSSDAGPTNLSPLEFSVRID